MFFASLFSSNVKAIGIRIGEEIRFRYISEDSADYTNQLFLNESDFNQRIRFYLEGIISDNITAGIKFHSRGIGGIPYNEQVTFDGISRPNFAVWLENAYVKLKYPWIDLNIGKQEMLDNEGLILNDNTCGFDGISANFYLPLHIGVKGLNFLIPDNEGKQWNILGGELSFLILKHKLNLLYINEKTLSLEKDKNFQGARIKGPIVPGVDYHISYIQQTGKINNNKYQGDALLGGIISEASIPVLGSGTFQLEYGQGSGNNEFTSDDEGFYSEFGFLPEEDYGEYYMENRNPQQGRNNSLENLSLLKLGIKVSPIQNLYIGFNYYNYTLTSRKVDNIIGTEYDTFLIYQLSPGVNLKFVHARFSPQEAANFPEGDGLKILTELQVEF